MKIMSRLGSIALPFINLLGTASVAVVANAFGTEPAFLHDVIAIDKGIVGPLFNTLASFFSDKTYDNYKELIHRKDYGFEGELQKAYQAALEVTFYKLQESCLKSFSNISSDLIKTFFTNLENDYIQLQGNTNETATHKILEAYIDTKGIFFDTVLNILQLDASSLEAKLLRFVAERFPDEMEQAFLEQMVKPEHELARTGFMIYLGEENLRISNANQETLLEVSQLLETITKNQRVGQHLQKEALRVQNLANEKLRQMGYILKEIREGIDTLLHQTAVQLPLYLPDIKLDSDRKDLFQFKAAYTTFIGRETEIQQLDEFVRVDNEYPVRWLLVTGPGGIGKSRLALEYCQMVRQQGFDAGFLTEENLDLLQDYQPYRPTLVVIDYVTARYKQVLRAILNLYRRKTTNNPLSKNNNLRLLLLERNTDGNWWDDFKEDAEVWSCRFLLDEKNQPILPLSGFNEAKRWQIIKEVYQKSNKQEISYDREEILMQLDRLDPQKRPLFAFFMGIALADGHFANLRQWNVHNLLDSLLAREKREFWKVHETYEQKEPKLHENLLALVTLTQGLPQDTISELCEGIAKNRKWLPGEPDINLFNSMAQVREDEGEHIWEGLQPDLLGEYFVLTRLKEWLHRVNKSKAEKEIIALIQAAWETNPRGTRDFIEKALRDYEELSHSEVYQLLINTPPAATARKEVWGERGWLLVSGTVRPFTLIGELANPIKYFKILENETDQLEDGDSKKLLVLRKAQATFNLIMNFCNPEQSHLAEQYYTKLEYLLLNYVEPDIALVQAKACNNLIAYFVMNEEFEKTEKYYEDSIALKLRFKTPELAVAQTNAAVNMTTYFGNSVQLKQAKKYYNDITDLLEEFNTPEIALGLAQAAKHLVIHCSNAGYLEQSEQYYENIVSLFNKFNMPEIGFVQAQAAASLSNIFGKIHKFEEAEWYYQQIATLIEKLILPDIAEVQSSLTLNLVMYFGRTGAFERAEHYYRKITTFQNRYDNLEVAISQAKAASYLCITFAQNEECVRPEIYYGQVERLLHMYSNYYFATVVTEFTLKYFNIIYEIIYVDKSIVTTDRSKIYMKLYYDKLIALYNSFL